MRSYPLLFIISFLSFIGKAEIKLPAILSDHMVLQSNAKVHIWGKASPGEKITVLFLKQKLSVTSDTKGNWSVWLKPMKAGEFGDMSISGTNTILIKDVLIGEVWIGSGQSNMEWSVKQSNNSEEELANSKNQMIRIFKVKSTVAPQPVDDVIGEWKICGPDAIENFSGCLYFFGRELFKVKKVPVGLIESCWGATPGESWLSKSAIENNNDLKYITEDWNRILAKFPEAVQKYKESIEKWKTDSVKNKAEGKDMYPKPRFPIGPGHKNTPSVLYNAMIAPLAAFTIKGVIWYQGEANAYEKTAFPYRYLLKALITDWRKAWGQGDFPFLIAQLSTLNKHPYWPVLRESQAEAAKLPNTALIVTVDIGDSTDAHFKNKQDVGFRFSLAARHVAYGEDITFSGPVFKNYNVEGNQIRVYFDFADGLQIKGEGTIKGFTIAGADGKFVPALANIDGTTVIVKSQLVEHPVSVRYAFKDAPVVNLINSAHLPAVPFRTDIK